MSRETGFQQSVMIVDDSEPALKAITRVLRDAGLDQVVTCQDSRRVMGMISPDVAAIVLDLVMPHVDGEELIGRIREGHPEIPVIVLTGTDDVKTAVRCMRLGAFDYVVKAPEMPRLVNAVGHALIMGGKPGFFQTGRPPICGKKPGFPPQSVDSRLPGNDRGPHPWHCGLRMLPQWVPAFAGMTTDQITRFLMEGVPGPEMGFSPVFTTISDGCATIPAICAQTPQIWQSQQNGGLRQSNEVSYGNCEVSHGKIGPGRPFHLVKTTLPPDHQLFLPFPRTLGTAICQQGSDNSRRSPQKKIGFGPVAAWPSHMMFGQNGMPLSSS